MTRFKACGLTILLAFTIAFASFFLIATIENESLIDYIKQLQIASRNTIVSTPYQYQTHSPFNSSIYTHSESFSRKSIYNGIDVSEWNGDINWRWAKQDGVDFAFIRVGLRFGSGKLGTDSNYKENFEGALKNKIAVGGYIFSQATTEEKAREEAKLLIEKLGRYKKKIKLPLIIDYEFLGDNKGILHKAIIKGKLSADGAAEVINAFCDEVKKSGYTCGLYANYDMLQHHINIDKLDKDCIIWVANWTDKINEQDFIKDKYSIWQYTSSGFAKWSAGNKVVDANFLYCDEDFFSK